MVLPLLVLFVISASGLLLYFSKKPYQPLLNVLIALGAGSMLALSLVHILPEALEQSEWSVYAFLAGFLVVYVLEEILTPHSHDHSHGDHSHEDPHEHYDHVALVSFLAIFTHTIFDGFGIRAGFGISETVGFGILAGVAIHQIPVSLSLAAIFRESALGRVTQISFLLVFALAAPIGYALSDAVLTRFSGAVFASLATAFAGGSLLYVATTDLLPIVHSKTRNKYPMIAVFLVAAILVASAKTLESERSEGSANSMESVSHP